MGYFDDIVPVTPREYTGTLCDVPDCHCRGLGHAWRLSDLED